MNRLLLGLLSALLLSSAALAQDTGSRQGDMIFLTQAGPGHLPDGLAQGNTTWTGGQGPVKFFSMRMAGSEVTKNAPYTATATTESTQTLADGNRIINKSSAFLARDSQGRTRREEAMNRIGQLLVDSPELVMISDPVSLTNYTLLPKEHYVNAVKYQEFMDAPGRRKQGDGTTRITWKAESDSSEQPVTTHEDLGMRSIEGVSCHGTRETTTIPAGHVGNERPIVTTTEVWNSPDLHAIVVEKHSDPRTGESVYRLTNIKLGEPDASLFQVPAGYTTEIEGEGVHFKQRKPSGPDAHE